MVDLILKANSLRLSWIYKFFNADDAMWKTLFSFWTERVGGMPLCLQYNCHIKHMKMICKKRNLPMFYMDLLCTWSEIRYLNKFEVKDIPNEILWNNSNIVIDNKPLYFPSWIKKMNLSNQTCYKSRYMDR